ncbi:30S ribosomal protein S5 [Candidatus Woesearchaeota archaeon]|nr:30S ribosomal protein S5 [Candidatus Woesearchaeota archaeon]
MTVEKKKFPEAEKSKLESTGEALAIEEVKAVSEEPEGVLLKEESTESDWKPKTLLGRKVKTKEITNIDVILDDGKKILESRIVDELMPTLEVEFIAVGQSKGKFGGGKRSIWRQTQKKTAEGNKPKFSALAFVGNKNGYIGIGYGKAKETVPAREKSIRKAKLNIMKIRRGCGSWACNCKAPHSIPFSVKGKCGSVIVVLKPAPKGTGLVVEKECAKLLSFAGIKDVHSITFGMSRTKLNLIKACIYALQELNATKIKEENVRNLGIVEGMV